MPAPSSPPATGPAVFAHRSQTPAQAVAQQFAPRPTLRQVVGQMLQRSIQEQYPTLAIDLDVTRLAIPNQRGGWDLKRLLDVALDYLPNGTALDFSPSANGRRYFLSNYRARHLTYEAQGPREPDMGIIESKVLELADTLGTGFQDALSDYWNQTGDTGANPGGPYCPGQPHLQSDRTRPVGDAGPQVMVYRVSGDLECYPSIEAFNQAWGQSKAGQEAADSVIKRSEPDSKVIVRDLYNPITAPLDQRLFLNLLPN